MPAATTLAVAVSPIPGGGKRDERPVVDGTEGQESRLVFFDVDAADCVDRLFEQVQFAEDLREEQFEVHGQHVAFAAGAEHDVPGHCQQSFRVQLRGVPPVRDEDVRLLSQRPQFSFQGPVEFFHFDLSILQQPRQPTLITTMQWLRLCATLTTMVPTIC